ncbi:MAG: oxygen-independent coproporphyrinogen III oxidase [Syntrophaceae bacterium]|nr:MAG: oxygen-independent coproporphyrinogen III oxidase [Syntrophaceae bacterium]
MKTTQAGLYIHIPFCLSKCGYCSFYSVSSVHLIPEFIKAVINEMAFYKSLVTSSDMGNLNSSAGNVNLSFPRKRESRKPLKSLDSRFRGNDMQGKMFKSFDTLYIGGGTPSLLSVQQIDDILKAVNNNFNIDQHPEITMEVNPGDMSLEYFQQLRKLGINRLNIGIQSFDDAILKFLGRRHTAREARSVMDEARQAGFDNIGIDLIYGVYGQDMKTWRETLNKALSFFPEHLSCYQLSLEGKTPLYKQYRKDSLQLPSENEALDFFMTTSQILTDAGYIHYEVSNFARTNSLKSRHNMKYWRHTPYLGLGPAAHSFIDRKRWWNRAAVKTYLRYISEGKMPVEKSEQLSIEQLALEALFLGMRTKDGIHLQQYKNRFDADILFDKKQVIDELMKKGLLELKDGRLKPTLDGMAVADSLALI